MGWNKRRFQELPQEEGCWEALMESASEETWTVALALKVLRKGKIPPPMIPKRGNTDERFQILWEIPVLLDNSYSNWHISELEKTSLWGWDREVLYSKSPWLAVHRWPSGWNNHNRQEQPPFLDTCSPEAFSISPRLKYCEIKLALSRLSRLSASFCPAEQSLSRRAPRRPPTVAAAAWPHALGEFRWPSAGWEHAVPSASTKGRAVTSHARLSAKKKDVLMVSCLPSAPFWP